MKIHLFKIILTVIITLFISACHHKNTNIDLISWTNDAISIEDLKYLNIREKTITKGRDKLRDALIKQSFKKLYTKTAKLQNIDKSQDFINAYNAKQNQILIRALTHHLEINEIVVQDQEIVSYFNKNKEQYSASPKFSIYIYHQTCKTIKICNSLIKDKLNKDEFIKLALKNTHKVSGYFENVFLSKLNQKIQKELLKLNLNDISSAIHLQNEDYIFLLYDKYTPAIKANLSTYKNIIHKQMKKEKLNKRLLQIEQTLIESNQKLTSKSQETILATYAIQIGLDKQDKILHELNTAYDWLLADYGFYASDLFINLNIDQLRHEISLSPKAKKMMSRFDINIIELKIKDQNVNVLQVSKILDKNLDHLIHNNITTKLQITRAEFSKLYSELALNPYKLEKNRWVGPKLINKKAYWIKKTYQDIAKEDSNFLLDYKKYKRKSIGNQTDYMKTIGNSINLTINPIIYSKDWESLVNKYLTI